MLLIRLGSELVDTGSSGEYALIYRSTNRFTGLAASTVRIVVVVDTAAPVMALLGPNPLDVPTFIGVGTGDLFLPIDDWPLVGSVLETPPDSGRYRFVDSETGRFSNRSYRVYLP